MKWYVASLIERFEWDDEDRTNPDRRCLVWENQKLIRATDMARAYDKAVKLGHRECTNAGPMTNDAGDPGRFVFEGLAYLSPVYEEIEDGAEIMWTRHQGIKVKTARGMVRTKEELLYSRRDNQE